MVIAVEPLAAELDDEYDYSDPETVGYQDRLKHLRDTKGVARLRLGATTGQMLLRFADVQAAFADHHRYSASRTLSMQPMTSDGLDLFAYARCGVEHAWREGYGITKAGVMLEDLMEESLRPRTLFEDDSDKRTRLMTALDEVNGRFGKFTAVPAVQGFTRQWSARSESRSPNYTTRIAEVPAVRA